MANKDLARKKSKSIRFDPDILKWLDQEIKSNKTFASYSHAVDFALTKLKKEQEDRSASSQ